ncbi:MAG: hypothetical protein HYT06_01235 [Candidatus Levybacteria bacterium]|nr:hypothetical protein [Candidatus Levybacteria bacterium]
MAERKPRSGGYYETRHGGYYDKNPSNWIINEHGGARLKEDRLDSGWLWRSVADSIRREPTEETQPGVQVGLQQPRVQPRIIQPGLLDTIVEGFDVRPEASEGTSFIRRISRSIRRISRRSR